MEFTEISFCPLCGGSYSADQIRQHTQTSECLDKVKKFITVSKRFATCKELAERYELDLNESKTLVQSGFQEVPSPASSSTGVVKLLYTKGEIRSSEINITKNLSQVSNGIKIKKNSTCIPKAKGIISGKVSTDKSSHKSQRIIGPKVKPGFCKCKICGRVFRKGQMRTHLLMRHNDEPQSCLNKHEKGRPSTGPGVNPTASKDGEQTLHLENLMSIFGAPKVDGCSVDREKVQTDTCHICGLSFASSEEREDHCRTKCGVKEDSGIIAISEDPDGNGPYRYKCFVCEKTYSKRENCRRHMQTHNGEKFTCTTCGKDFKEVRYLRNHVKIHGDIAPYVCHVCGKAYKYSDALHAHMRSHTGPGPNRSCACKICGRQYSHPAGLHTHMRKHTGEAVLCPYCGKSFTHTSNYQVHLRRHTGVKPYVCSVCNKAFTQSGQLTVHMRTHSGEKPFVCHYCGRGFAENGTLKAHLTIHTGEKPYSCNVCSKAFSNRRSLNVHVATHNKVVVN